MSQHSRTPFYVAVFILMTIGAALATLRHVEMEVPWLPGEQKTTWLVEARLDFEAADTAVLASLNIPDSPPGFRILSESAASPGYGFSIVDKGGNRRAEWSKRQAKGQQTLYFKVQLAADPAVEATEKEAPQAQPVFWEEPQATAVEEVMAQAQAKSSTPESLARELIKLMQQGDAAQNIKLLLENTNQTYLLKNLLNHAGVPARVSEGLVLEDARRRQLLKPYLEIFDGNTWVAFNPETGEQGLPEHVLLWHRDSNSLLDVMGGSDSKVSFSTLRQTIPALELARDESGKNSLGFLSLYQLPVEEQSVFRTLLLLPLGALVVAFVRIIIGVKTSGTFMPILIALAFVQTTLVPGLIAFVSIVSIGLIVRGYLSSLNLLLVSRISTLILLVIFLTAAISIVGYQVGFNTGMTVTFFPMVILAWTIERMSILWEEEGGHEVLMQGGGSLLVAVITYLIMKSEVAAHLTFNFPELHLIILGIILLMGQYTGYKLSELRRFHPMKVYN